MRSAHTLSSIAWLPPPSTSSLPVPSAQIPFQARQSEFIPIPGLQDPLHIDPDTADRRASSPTSSDSPPDRGQPRLHRRSRQPAHRLEVERQRRGRVSNAFQRLKSLLTPPAQRGMKEDVVSSKLSTARLETSTDTSHVLSEA